MLISVRKIISLDKFRYRKYFDRKYYLEVNADVAKSKIDPLVHYLVHGWRELRNPSPYFSTAWYLGQYLDVKKSNQEPLRHYLIRGRFEKRQPHYLFDPDYYLSCAPDVGAMGVDPWIHFIGRGDREGLAPHPLFDPIYYRQAYRDIGDAAPFAHYAQFGARERRTPCPAFDPGYYVCHYPQAIEGRMEPLLHYLLSPPGTRRHFHPLLDAQYQKETNFNLNEDTEPLIEYISRRSHFNLEESTWGRATVIKPRRAYIGPKQNVKPFAHSNDVQISIIIRGSDPEHLRACIESMQSQQYRNWEAILVEECSATSIIRKCLPGDKRIRMLHLGATSPKISTAWSAGLSVSNGVYVAFLDGQKILTGDALGKIMSPLIQSGADGAYSDEGFGKTIGPIDKIFYKPDWSQVLLWGTAYIGGLLVLRKSLVNTVGGLNETYSANQVFDLMLRISEVSDKIIHVPHILCYSRATRNDDPSTAIDTESRRQSVNEHFRRIGFRGVAIADDKTSSLVKIRPQHNLSVPSFDLVIQGPPSTCKFELANRSEQLKAASTYILDAKLPKRLLLENSSSPFVLFLNPAIDSLDPYCLKHLLIYAERNDVGFAEPFLADASGYVLAAGFLVHPRLGLVPVQGGDVQNGQDGYFGLNISDREVSAVSGTCSLVRREVLMQIGGLSPDYLTLHGSIADASFRATLAGLRNIAIGGQHVKMSVSFNLHAAEFAIDRRLFAEAHGSYLREGDRYYNPNFREGSGDFRYL